jgi:drug/metabolite transporter (DMT)-like permease
VLTARRDAPAVRSATSTARRRAVLALAGGATILGLTSVLYELSHTSPATGAFYRCLWALPPLWLLTLLERRRLGRAAPRTVRWQAPAAAAGAFLGIDLVLWHHSIDDIGSGLATVVVTSQVIFAAGAARLFLRERVPVLMVPAVPLMLFGAALAAQVFAAAPSGRTVRGVLLSLAAAAAYAGYIVLLGVSARRGGRVAAPMFVSTATTAGTVLLIGALTGTIDLAPSWAAQGWLALLALDAQVVGWLLVTRAVRALPVASVAASLTLQAVSALVFGALLLAQRPTPSQLLGAVVLLAGVALANARRPARGG